MEEDTQRSLAAHWASKRKAVEDLLRRMEIELSSPRLQEAKVVLDGLLNAWETYQAIHVKYVPGIDSRERLQVVQDQFNVIKREATDIVARWEQSLKDQTLECGMEFGIPRVMVMPSRL